jgi:quinol-cytochrome oxidoreductase complex cytochrome b subunit
MSDQPVEKKSIPFYPDHVTTEAWVTLGFLGLVVVVAILGAIFPVGLGDKADPLNTPAHAKPEWYFLFLYQMLKFLPKTAGVLIPIIALIIFVIWPFLDRWENSKKTQRIRLIASIVFLIFVLVMTIWGELS